MPSLVIARTVDAAVEPLSVAEAKSHLNVEHASDDAYIGALVLAARQWVEEYTGRALITQTWTRKLDRFPASGEIVLPRPNLQSVSSITYLDTDGAEQTLAADQFDVQKDELPGRVTRGYGDSWPSTQGVPNAVTVTYTAGYGAAASDVPGPIVSAIRLIVGDMYANREERVVGTVVARLNAVDALLGPYRVFWF